MRIRISVPDELITDDVVAPVLEAVTRLNEKLIETGQSPTSHDLVDAGVKWRPEPPGDEHFDHGATLASRGWGDCDDWAPLHAATLRTTGEDPEATAHIVPSGPHTFHAIVQRSDGRIDDPSVAAGMTPLSGHGAVIGEDGTIDVCACDPHDGRIYAGSLLPTSGPLSLHCGPTFAVRGKLLPDGPYFEGRCDMPISGSRLVHVRSYWRRGGRRRRVHGMVPAAVSVIGHGRSPGEALNEAFCGQLALGEASGISSDIDHYKLLALQAASAGASPGQVRQMLVDKMTEDVHQKAYLTKTHPGAHVEQLKAQFAATEGIAVEGLFSDIGHLANGIVHSVSAAAKTVSSIANKVPWSGLIHDVQAAVSAVPGLGTAVSDVVAAAETAYDSVAALAKGDPLEAAVDAAYNFALGSVPGAAALHPILDPVRTTLMDLLHKHEPLDDAMLNGILAAIPDSPSFGKITPRSVAASLAHLIVGHLGVRKTGKPPIPHVLPMPDRPVVLPPRVMPPEITHPVARAILATKPDGYPHSAVHEAVAEMPGSPGAPAGGTTWHCYRLPDGHFECRWL